MDTGFRKDGSFDASVAKKRLRKAGFKLKLWLGSIPDDQPNIHCIIKFHIWEPICFTKRTDDKKLIESGGMLVTKTQMSSC